MKWAVSTICACFLWAVSCAADPFPALYDVTGVADDDVLNVRTAPSASADIIASYAAIRSGVEVVRLDPTGRWGLVNIGERSGWTSMRYLAVQPGQDGTHQPRPLFCFGTEPFWDALISTERTIRFDLMGQPSAALSEETTAFGRGRSDKFATVWNSSDTEIVGMMTRTACDDGMSDRAFGIAVDFLVSRMPGQMGTGTVFSGCCALSSD